MSKNKEIVKNQLEDYLISKGINPKKNFNCLNPEHLDNNPSMSFDRRRNKVHCFSCGVDYDTFDLIGIDYNLTTGREMFNKAYSIYGLDSLDVNNSIYLNTKNNSKNYIDRCYKNTLNSDLLLSYLEDRGLGIDCIKRYKLGFDEDFTHGTGGFNWQALIIPTSNSTYTARNMDKNADSRNRYRKAGNANFFNLDILYSEYEKPIFIVEGEIDALSVYEAGEEAVSLGSTSNISNFLNILRENKVSKTLILLLDNDEVGVTSSMELEKGLEMLGTKYYKADILGSYKDPNEALIKDRTFFISEVKKAVNLESLEIEKAKKEYKKNSSLEYLKDYKEKIIANSHRDYTPTGFIELDKMLEGGLFEGLYILGAISSIGKSTFAVQLADQMAQLENRDVLIFSLEMGRTELMAKSISRHTILNAIDGNINRIYAKTTRGITTGSRYKNYKKQEIDLIDSAVEEYAKYAENIYIIEGEGVLGVSQIKSSVEKHISITKKYPIVIIDYLQILAPEEIRVTDKQNIDRAVLELKRISRDFKLPIFVISSFNRENYKNEVSMSAFKESGAIEYGSDVLLALQFKGQGEKGFNIDKARTRDIRQLELKILKNRNGISGGKIDFEYHPKYNYFLEV